MFAFLKFVPLRWWLFLGAAAAFAFVLWHDHHLAQRLKAEKAARAATELERDQARATIETMKVDAALNRETTHALAERLADLQRDAREQPIRGLRCITAAATVPAESRAPSGTDGAGTGREPEAATFDPGPGLTEYGTDCAALAVKFEALQAWERARTH